MDLDNISDTNFEIEDDDDEEEDEFEVDKILDKRVNADGSEEYLVRWKPGWQHESAFHRDSKAVKQINEKIWAGKHKKYTEVIKTSKPLEILAAKQDDDDILLLIKFDELDEDGENLLDLVPFNQAQVHCPQLLIKYIESKIEFFDVNNEEEDDDEGETGDSSNDDNEEQEDEKDLSLKIKT